MPAFSSTSVLAGARDLNSINLAAAYQDLGGKIAYLLSFANAATSAISALNVAVSALNLGAQSASLSAASAAFTAFSVITTSSLLLTSYPGNFVNLTT